jgi:hypothetical protein
MRSYRGVSPSRSGAVLRFCRVLPDGALRNKKPSFVPLKRDFGGRSRCENKRYAFLNAFFPAKMEAVPNACSILISWLNFSTRSPLQPLPVFR